MDISLRPLLHFSMLVKGFGENVSSLGASTYLRQLIMLSPELLRQPSQINLLGLICMSECRALFPDSRMRIVA